MAFLQKVGNLVKRSAGSGSPLVQAVRCMSSSKLFIGGISYGTDEQSLRDAFAGYGEVIEAKIITDRETGRSRGFGFVTYTSTDEAAAAITGMDGKDLHGRMVRVSYAHDRGSRAGSYGGGGGGYYGGGGSYGGGGGSYGGGGGSYGDGGSYGGGGGYGRAGGYTGGGGGGGYNTGGGYGVSDAGGGGYGGNAGYAGGSGGYNAAPGNYSNASINQQGVAPDAYGDGNFGMGSDSYTSNASNDASAGKLDDLLSDLDIDGKEDVEGKGQSFGLVDEDSKGDDGQDDLLQDDFKDEEEPDDYANKRS